MPLAQSASKLSPPLLPPPSSDKKQRKHGALARTRNAESNNSTQLQRLCDETRAQYELLLERQETNHERQLHAAQSKLQDVLCSHISLIEHEKILFAEAERFRSEREQLDAAHARELAQLDTKWRSEWETRETALLARCEEEKHLVLDMIPPLELERNDAHRLLKEQEIGAWCPCFYHTWRHMCAHSLAMRTRLDQLTWSKALDEANRARERAEVRLREACKHILTLKTCVKRLEQRPDTSAQERERAMALNNKWQQSKFELATVKGELASRITAVEKDFAHAHEALADEKARASDLQVRRVVQLELRMARSVVLIVHMSWTSAKCMTCKASVASSRRLSLSCA